MGLVYLIGLKMEALDILKIDEGLRLKPYHCSANKLTIGYGRNLEDNGITQEEAEYLLRNDFERAKYQLAKEFTFTTRLLPIRFEVLAMMVFNMGITRFRGFKKMLAAIESGNTQVAVDEMLNSKWATQVGSRADRLADAYLRNTFT